MLAHTQWRRQGTFQHSDGGSVPLVVTVTLRAWSVTLNTLNFWFTHSVLKHSWPHVLMCVHKEWVWKLRLCRADGPVRSEQKSAANFCQIKNKTMWETKGFMRVYQRDKPPLITVRRVTFFRSVCPWSIYISTYLCRLILCKRQSSPVCHRADSYRQKPGEEHADCTQEGQSEPSAVLQNITNCTAKFILWARCVAEGQVHQMLQANSHSNYRCIYSEDTLNKHSLHESKQG